MVLTPEHTHWFPATREGGIAAPWGPGEGEREGEWVGNGPLQLGNNSGRTMFTCRAWDG